MEIAVSHVTKGADAEPVLLGHLVDKADHPGQLAAGHGGVFEDGRRRHPGQRAEGRTTRTGQRIGLGLGGRLANLPTPVGPGDLFHASGFFSHLGRMTVGFHEQQGLAIGEPDLGVVFDAPEGGPVEELEGAGDDLGGDDVGDRLGGRIHRIEGGHQGLLGRGLRDEPEQHPGDHAEGSLAADEEVFQGIPGDVLHALVAREEDLAVGQDDFQAHHVIAGDAVLEPTQTARILGHVAADGADLHRTRIGRIEQAGRRRRLGDLQRGGPGFGQQGQVGPIDLQDAVHVHRA